MPSPFPGMDPYLEQPAFWPEFHGALAFKIQEMLNPLLPEAYVARVEPYVHIGYWDEEDSMLLRPDVAVTHDLPTPTLHTATSAAIMPAPLKLATQLREEIKVYRVRILHGTESRLVTVVEILSPINKRPGNPAYDAYLQKRGDLLETRVHLLEIDLLRKGRRVPMFDPLPDAPYFIILGRSDERPMCEIWPLQLQDVLPVIPVPLLPGDPDVPLDLGAAFTQVYDSARFDKNVNYRAESPGPLSDAQRVWISERLAAAGVRP